MDSLLKFVAIDDFSCFEQRTSSALAQRVRSPSPVDKRAVQPEPMGRARANSHSPVVERRGAATNRPQRQRPESAIDMEGGEGDCRPAVRVASAGGQRQRRIEEGHREQSSLISKHEHLLLLRKKLALLQAPRGGVSPPRK